MSYINITMPNYANGKIYKIEPKCKHEPHEVYYGSTTEERLCDRFAGHVYGYNTYHKNLKENKNCKKIRSYELFDKYGVENCRIVLMESVNAKSWNELRTQEEKYISNYKCVNYETPVGQAMKNKMATLRKMQKK